MRRGEWGVGLDSALQQERAKLLAFTTSHSWRITRPLREAKRWILTPGKQIKSYMRGILRLAKRVFQYLPMSLQNKAKFRQWIARVAPRVLLATGAHSSTISVLSISKSSIGKVTIKERSQSFEVQSLLNHDVFINTSDKPLISIIIPIYGKVDYTLRCLSSIADHPSFAEFEVIIVDDCSPDDSRSVLSHRVRGIQILSNDSNQGFIRSCNTGAKAAKGQYLCFLNNDTEVTDGWLDALLRTFGDFPGTGLVGSKLVYPDGRLQEAGGIVWQDGSAWNFGRNQDPQLPVFNYAREVDYCSGASIMVPKPLFQDLGGFDEHYLPAYCEDTDLALKVRDKGLRVIYQPLSTVIHYEGVTSGTDTSSGVKAYQVENTNKLYSRWQNTLAFHQAPGCDVDNAKDRKATRRILFLDHCTPTPNQDSGSIDAYNQMLLMREMGFQLTFIPEDNFLYMPGYTDDLQSKGIEMLYTPYVISIEQHIKEHGSRYDLVFISRPGVFEKNIDLIRKYCKKAKVLFHTVDLHFLRMGREAELLNSNELKQKAAKMKKRELNYIKESDIATVLSVEELKVLQRDISNEKVRLLPYARAIEQTQQSFEERKDIVFVGGYQHRPNVDAVKFFVKKIMPLLRKKLPGVCFYVVGSNPPQEILKLACKDIYITGFLEDLNPILGEMRVSVAPLRYGAGIKGKIGTAMTKGLPVVATSLAAEGMQLTDGEDILIADIPEEFASAVASIYQDKDLWYRISQNGLAFADKAWGAESAFNNLSSILCELGLTPTQNNRELVLYKADSSVAPEVKRPDFKENLFKAERDEYEKKIKEELKIYENQVNVHDLPEIFHYWSNKHLTPIFHQAGFSTIAEFFSSNLMIAAQRTNRNAANFISIGSGNCDLEVSVAKNLINAGFDKFNLECLEINPEMLDRGREIAKQNGVLENMHFVEADFNIWVPSKYYDGVMANQSLHHVVRLEHLFDQVKKSLKENGSFIISDMIGRNGHQRWPEALEIVNKFWKELSESKKFNVLLNRFENEYDNWDCSKEGFEGIRSQEILPLLLQRFQCEKFIGFGNAIDIFVDRCFGHNFDVNSPEDKDFIDRVHAEDEAGFSNGLLKPTHMMAIFVKTLCNTPYYSRGISPVSSVRNSNY